MSRQAGRVGRTFESFGHRNYRLLWTGSLLSTTAFMTTFLLVPVVAYEITGSYTASGIALMGSGLSMFFLGPFGGVIADRYAKKPLVLIGQIFPTLLIVITGFLIVTDVITVWMLFLSTLLMGFGFALMGPARQAWLGELVPRRLLANGVALQQMSQNMARVFGPMLVSVLLAAFAFSTGYLYLIVASFFLIVIPLTTMLPKTKPTRREGEPPRVLAEMKLGFAYLLKTPRLRVLWVFWMVMVVCSFAFNTLMPGFVEREFDRPSTDAFNVYLIFGAASFFFNIPLAGLVGGRWGWPLLLITGFGSAVSFFLFAVAPSFEGMLVMSVLNGASTSGVMLVTMSLMMAHSRPEYFGRVMSFITLGYGAQSIMAGVWGGIADALGGRQTFVVIGVIALAITAFMVVAWLRTRHLPLEYGTAAAETGLAPARSSGPPLRRQPVPAFTAQVAPVVLMEGQKPRGEDAIAGTTQMAGGGD